MLNQLIAGLPAIYVISEQVVLDFYLNENTIKNKCILEKGQVIRIEKYNDDFVYLSLIHNDYFNDKYIALVNYDDLINNKNINFII